VNTAQSQARSTSNCCWAEPRNSCSTELLQVESWRSSDAQSVKSFDYPCYHLMCTRNVAHWHTNLFNLLRWDATQQRACVKRKQEIVELACASGSNVMFYAKLTCCPNVITHCKVRKKSFAITKVICLHCQWLLARYRCRVPVWLLTERKHIAMGQW